MKEYKLMTDNEKKNTIKSLYENQKKSFMDIAKLLNTYANKIRRDAIKFKIKIRDKSLAQKNALSTGKIKHPTKGTTRNIETKNKIGKGVMNSWDKLSAKELQLRKDKAKQNWESLDDDEKEHILKKANEAVRKSSKEGSKLEKFIFEHLIKDGFKPQFHQEQSLLNTKLQIDIAIPSMNVAIEIDGPSHFQPVWGDDALKRNIKYDQKKEGLILGKGIVLIRIIQSKDFSKARSLVLYQQLKDILSRIKTKKNLSETKFIIKDI